MPLWDGMCLHHLHVLYTVLQAVVAIQRPVVMETSGLRPVEVPMPD